MQDIDRRNFLRSAVCGAAAATVVAAGSTILISTAAKVAPLALDKVLPGTMDGMIQQVEQDRYAAVVAAVVALAGDQGAGAGAPSVALTLA